MPSNEFNSFVESYFGDAYMAWHDGLDEQSLRALKGEEREQAEKMLLDAMDSGDYRIAAGLRVLQSTGSVAKLKSQLGDATGTGRVQIALALWEIAEWPPAAKALIDELKNGAYWGSQMDAAMALENVNTPESIEALLGALNDPEDLVRNHATESLIDMLGLPFEESNTGGYDIAIDMMMDEGDERRKKAFEAIKRAVREKQAEDQR